MKDFMTNIHRWMDLEKWIGLMAYQTLRYYIVLARIFIARQLKTIFSIDISHF